MIDSLFCDERKNFKKKNGNLCVNILEMYNIECVYVCIVCIYISFSSTLNFHSLYFIRWFWEADDSLPSPAYVKCSNKNSDLSSFCSFAFRCSWWLVWFFFYFNIILRFNNLLIHFQFRIVAIYPFVKCKNNETNEKIIKLQNPRHLVHFRTKYLEKIIRNTRKSKLRQITLGPT